MKAYAVEKERVPVTVRLAGEGERRGALFLAAGADSPTVNRIRELLNSPERFLPIELEGQGPQVFNKDRLVWVRHDGPQGPVVEVMAERRRMTLVLGDGTRLVGDVVADGPPDRRRVLDCLNLATGFLLVEAEDGDYVVRQAAVAAVPSAELGDPRPGDSGSFEVEDPAPG